MEKLCRRLKYFGYDEKVYQKYIGELDKRNNKSLMKCSKVTMLAVLLCTILTCIFVHDMRRVLLGIVLCPVMGLLYYYAAGLRKSGKSRPVYLYSMMVTYMILLYSAAVLLGTFFSEGQISAFMIWMFFFLQVCFDMPVKIGFPVTFLFYVIFLILSYQMKAVDIFARDFVNASISMMVGFYTACSKSRVAFANVVAETRLKEKNEILYHISITDELTNLFNRRRMIEELQKIECQCRKRNTDYAVAIMDIDKFKYYNDFYGHPQGDRLLMEIGQMMGEFGKAENAVVGRIGGEEFMMIWESEGFESDNEKVEKFRRMVEEHHIPNEGSPMDAKYITVSIGVCAEQNLGHEGKYKKADQALYRAKKQGRNQVCWCKPEVIKLLEA